MVSRDSKYFLLLNVGHFLDHYFMLIFATVAALTLSAGWGMSYAELLPYGLWFYRVCSLFFTNGYLGRSLGSRPNDGCLFHWYWHLINFDRVRTDTYAIGCRTTPHRYFWVDLPSCWPGDRDWAMETHWNAFSRERVWGNLGVGCAALVTGFMIDLAGWRTAFFIPGIISIFFAFPYLQISRNVEELPPLAVLPQLNQRITDHSGVF